MSIKLQNILNTEVKLLAYFIFTDEGSLVVPIETTSKLIKRSVVSLKRDRAEGVGIPTCQLGKGTGSDKVYYNVYDIAKFIVQRKTKVMS